MQIPTPRRCRSRHSGWPAPPLVPATVVAGPAAKGGGGLLSHRFGPLEDGSHGWGWLPQLAASGKLGRQSWRMVGAPPLAACWCLEAGAAVIHGVADLGIPRPDFSPEVVLGLVRSSGGKEPPWRCCDGGCDGGGAGGLSGGATARMGLAWVHLGAIVESGLCEVLGSLVPQWCRGSSRGDCWNKSYY